MGTVRLCQLAAAPSVILRAARGDTTMDFEIKKLTSGLAEDYARFFDATPHWDSTPRDELPCYCITWRNDDTYAGNDHWYPTREERRERAIRFVGAGSMQGYLAYWGGKIVGWCNATADCRLGVEHLRSYYPIEDYSADVKVKSIFCFMVAPQAQRMGAATQLVERVCKDAAADGFDYVEAYPNKEYTPPDCKGPLQMYIKCGFTISAERDGLAVVRKKLK